MRRRIEVHTFGKETGKAMLTRQNVITKAHYRTVKCKFCGDWESVVQYGHTKRRVQRYLCRKCGHTFVDNLAPGKKQHSKEAIISVLNQFYESASLSKIQRQLELTHGVKPKDSTIYRWVAQYSKKAAEALRDIPVKVGSTWVADETVVKLKAKGGSKSWFWDIIDDRTRFLLASHMSEGRSRKDAQALMEQAARRAGKVPRTIITDKLTSYLDGVELAFGAETKHIPAKKLTSKPGTQMIERFQGTLKDRTKVMRSMFRKGAARIITDGWLAHYNFFRPHQALEGKTPAQAAGVDSPYKSWRDVVEKE